MTISSTPSATVSTTLTLTTWWLKDPTNTALDAQVYLEAVDYVLKEAQETVFPLGSTKAVVLRSELTGATFDLKFICTTPAQYAALKALHDTQHTLLLQSDMTDQWYLSMGPEFHVSLFNTPGHVTAPLRKVEVQGIEVSTP